jgi:alanine dehydrogenase
MNTIKVAVLREGKVPPDKRVPFTPEQCKEMMDKFPGIELIVQPSEIRCFEDEAYLSQGVKVKKDVSGCDVLIGVKEVPVEDLIADKTYLYFSHTHKLQPYNRKLISTMIDKNIRMIDYECLTYPKGGRVLGFGRFAGIVGAYNGFLAYGKKYNAYDIKAANACDDMKEMLGELSKVKLPNIKIILTGSGRVSRGSVEILEALGIKKVNTEAFLKDSFDEPVYCQIDVDQYNSQKDGLPFDKKHFYRNGPDYVSNFERFTKVSDMFIAGHFWDNKAPVFFTKAQAQSPDFKIKVIADVSCDIACAIPSTLRPSTIVDPVYDYDVITGKEAPAYGENTITVMAVDNLPCELPKDASLDFGRHMLDHILPQFFNDDEGGILENASLCKDGGLSTKYAYMSDFVAGKV